MDDRLVGGADRGDRRPGASVWLYRALGFCLLSLAPDRWRDRPPALGLAGAGPPLPVGLPRSTRRSTPSPRDCLDKFSKEFVPVSTTYVTLRDHQRHPDRPAQQRHLAGAADLPGRRRRPGHRHPGRPGPLRVRSPSRSSSCAGHQLRWRRRDLEVRVRLPAAGPTTDPGRSTASSARNWRHPCRG